MEGQQLQEPGKHRAEQRTEGPNTPLGEAREMFMERLPSVTRGGEVISAVFSVNAAAAKELAGRDLARAFLDHYHSGILAAL